MCQRIPSSILLGRPEDTSVRFNDPPGVVGHPGPEQSALGICERSHRTCDSPHQSQGGTDPDSGLGGRRADFIVIDKDFFTIPEDQIHPIKILLTAVGGKTVYRDPNY